jgi:hypothetical protein
MNLCLIIKANELICETFFWVTSNCLFANPDNARRDRFRYAEGESEMSSITCRVCLTYCGFIYLLLKRSKLLGRHIFPYIRVLFVVSWSDGRAVESSYSLQQYQELIVESLPPPIGTTKGPLRNWVAVVTRIICNFSKAGPPDTYEDKLDGLDVIFRR